MVNSKIHKSQFIPFKQRGLKVLNITMPGKWCCWWHYVYPWNKIANKIVFLSTLSEFVIYLGTLSANYSRWYFYQSMGFWQTFPIIIFRWNICSTYYLKIDNMLFKTVFQSMYMVICLLILIAKYTTYGAVHLLLINSVIHC